MRQETKLKHENIRSKTTVMSHGRSIDLYFFGLFRAGVAPGSFSGGSFAERFFLQDITFTKPHSFPGTPLAVSTGLVFEASRDSPIEAGQLTLKSKI